MQEKKIAILALICHRQAIKNRPGKWAGPVDLNE
jgi:hypothetical protein